MSDNRHRSRDKRNGKKSWSKDSQQNRSTRSHNDSSASTSNTGFRDDDVMNFVVETLNRRTSGNAQSAGSNGGYQYLKADWLNDLHLDSMPEALAHRHDRSSNGRNRNKLKNRVTRPGENHRSYQAQGPTFQSNTMRDSAGPGTSASSSAGSSQWNPGNKITVSEYLTETQALEQRMAEIHRELAMLDGEEPRNATWLNRCSAGAPRQPTHDPEQEQLLRAMEHAVRDRQKEIEQKEKEIKRRQRMLDMEIRSSKPSTSERFSRLQNDRTRVTSVNQRRKVDARNGNQRRPAKRGNTGTNSSSRHLSPKRRKQSPPIRRSRLNENEKRGGPIEKIKKVVIEAISDAEDDNDTLSKTQDEATIELEEVSEISDIDLDLGEENSVSEAVSDEEVNETEALLEEMQSTNHDEVDEVVSDRAEQIKGISREHLAAALEAEMIEVDISDEEPEPDNLVADEFLPIEDCGKEDVSDDELPVEAEIRSTSAEEMFLDTTEISDDEPEVKQKPDDQEIDSLSIKVTDVVESLTNGDASNTLTNSSNVVDPSVEISDSPASPDPEEPVQISPPASPTFVEQEELCNTDETDGNLHELRSIKQPKEIEDISP